MTTRRLEAAGVSGELYPFDTAADRGPLRAAPPDDLLECWLALPGYRGDARWEAPQDPLRALVEFAVGWCQWGDPTAKVHVTAAIEFAYTADGPVAHQMLDLLVQHPHDWFNVTGVTSGGRFRHVVVCS